MLEDRLRSHALISQAMVVGDGRPYIGALITLDPETLGLWKARHGKPADATSVSLRDDPDLLAAVQAAVDDANRAVRTAWLVHEVGMLRALAEAGIEPDLVVGTSIGALNGVLVAADPAGAADRLRRMWQGEELRLAFSEKLWSRLVRLVRSGTHLHSFESLGRMLAGVLPGP